MQSIRTGNGPSKPTLSEIFKRGGEPLKRPIIAWYHYAGMGDYVNSPASKETSKLVRKFIKSGLIVPTFSRDIMGMEEYTELKHIDDVNWARNQKGQLVFYELSQNPYFPDHEDSCFPLKKKFKNAKEHVEHHLNMGSAIEDDPLELKSGEIITPIIMGHNDGGIRQRQKGIFPNSLDKHRKDYKPFT